jgi:DNA-binding response OmpR family regulator
LSSDQAKHAIRVLLVDDSQTFLDSCTRFLTGQDSRFEIRQATRLDQAMAIAQVWAPQLVLLDFMLPDGTGVELIPPLRERFPQVPIVMLTFFETDVLRQLALSRGATGFVRKTEIFAELMPVIVDLFPELRPPDPAA